MKIRAEKKIIKKLNCAYIEDFSFALFISFVCDYRKMAFFKRNAGGSKRKLGQKRKATGNAPKNAKRATKDDEILSSDDEEGGLVEGKHSLKNLSDHEEEIFEDAQTKSARESKRVLEQLEVLF